MLDLSYNNISSRSVTITSALKKHSNLTLLMSDNEITEHAAEEISAIVKNNTLLRNLLLGNNQLQSLSCGRVKHLSMLELISNSVDEMVADKLTVTLSSCA